MTRQDAGIRGGVAGAHAPSPLLARGRLVTVDLPSCLCRLRGRGRAGCRRPVEARTRRSAIPPAVAVVRAGDLGRAARVAFLPGVH